MHKYQHTIIAVQSLEEDLALLPQIRWVLQLCLYFFVQSNFLYYTALTCMSLVTVEVKLNEEVRKGITYRFLKQIYIAKSAGFALIRCFQLLNHLYMGFCPLVPIIPQFFLSHLVQTGQKSSAYSYPIVLI